LESQLVAPGLTTLHQALPTNPITPRGRNAAWRFAGRDVALAAGFASDENTERFKFSEDGEFLFGGNSIVHEQLFSVLYHFLSATNPHTSSITAKGGVSARYP
jgi:hypothetical protein